MKMDDRFPVYIHPAKESVPNVERCTGAFIMTSRRKQKQKLRKEGKIRPAGKAPEHIITHDDLKLAGVKNCDFVHYIEHCLLEPLGHLADEKKMRQLDEDLVRLGKKHKVTNIDMVMYLEARLRSASMDMINKDDLPKILEFIGKDHSAEPGMEIL